MVDDKLLSALMSKGSGDSMESIAKLWLVKSMMENDKKKNNLDLNELLGYMLIMNMTKQMQTSQPASEDNIDKLMKMAMVSKMVGGDDKMFAAMMGLNKNSTDSMMKMMEMMNPTKELVKEMKDQKEAFAEAIKGMNENQLAQFAAIMQTLEDKLNNLKKGDDLLALEQFLEKQKRFLELRQELIGLAQEDQLSKKAVKEDGSIDWKNLLLTKGLSILEKMASEKKPKGVKQAAPLSKPVPEKNEGTGIVKGEELLEKPKEVPKPEEPEPEHKAEVIKSEPKGDENVRDKGSGEEKVNTDVTPTGQGPSGEEHSGGTEIVAVPKEQPKTRNETNDEAVLGRDRGVADRHSKVKVIPPEGETRPEDTSNGEGDKVAE